MPETDLREASRLTANQFYLDAVIEERETAALKRMRQAVNANKEGVKDYLYGEVCRLVELYDLRSRIRSEARQATEEFHA